MTDRYGFVPLKDDGFMNPEPRSRTNITAASDGAAFTDLIFKRRPHSLFSYDEAGLYIIAAVRQRRDDKIREDDADN